MELIKSALFFICLLLGFVYWWRRRRYFQLGAKLPGPPALPILGNALYFTTKDLCTAFREYMQLSRIYGPVSRLWFGPALIVILTDADHVEKVVNHDKVGTRGYVARKMFGPAFTNGLLSIDKERWRSHRKIVSSALHINILKTFVETFARHSDILATNLSRLADGTNAHDIMPSFLCCTLDSVCETCFDYEMNAQVNDDNFSVDQFKAIIDIITKLLEPWLLIDWIFRLSRIGKKHFQAIKFFRDIIISRIERKQEAKQTPNEVNGQKPTLLDLLHSGGLSKEDIIAEIVTIAGAATETTSSACCYVLALLGENQHIQDKVMQEQQDIFGDDILRPVSSEDLPRMTYLEQVLKEAMRLFPPVLIHGRVATTEIDLGEGHIIPKGAHTTILPYCMHRDPKHFPDPHKFDPDRFSPQNSADRHPYAYTPFGMGRRMCVGHVFATMEAKTILSTVLRRYRVTETEGGIKGLEKTLKMGFVLQLANGVRVKLLPRSHP